MVQGSTGKITMGIFGACLFVSLPNRCIFKTLTGKGIEASCVYNYEFYINTKTQCKQTAIRTTEAVLDTEMKERKYCWSG